MADTISVRASTTQLWRAGDVAAFYGVVESTVHRWERRGAIRESRRDPGGTKYWLATEVVGDAAAPVAPAGRSSAGANEVTELVGATRRRRSRR